ncbi:MAG TPA: hypothetical protein PL182_00380 [Pseudobdellovibrionaceae bacterium]|nr:hypothetical protein [Pseudobdellovibrionaceae bacterium]
MKKPPSLYVPSAASTGLAGGESEFEAIRRLQECLESEKCDYPQTDPQSYSLGVGQDLERSLKSLARRMKTDPNLSAEAEELARELIKNPDGHVQEGALAILGELPPAAENLAALLEGLKNNPADPLILEQASSELVRYLGSAEEASVHRFFAETLTDGALFTSQKAGTVLRRFLTPGSLSYYQEILKRLPEDSTKARFLRGTIEEFERRLQGG